MSSPQATDPTAKAKAGRSHVKRATDAVERTIEREMPELDLYERRRFWLLLMSYCAGRLREFDEGLKIRDAIRDAGEKTTSLIAELGPDAPTEKEIADANAERHTGDTCQTPQQRPSAGEPPDPADCPLVRE